MVTKLSWAETDFKVYNVVVYLGIPLLLITFTIGDAKVVPWPGAF